MAQDKIKNAKSKLFKTSVGELKGFIALTKPYISQQNPEGVYIAQILIPKEEGEEYVKILAEVQDEQFKIKGKGTKKANHEQCVPYVDEEGNPDKEGRYLLKTKLKAKIKDGVPAYHPVIKNALNQYIHGDIKIGEGTKASIVFYVQGYTYLNKTGTSVILQAIQIINLVEYGSPSDYDFDIVEGGYEGTGYSLGDGVRADESDEEVPF